MGEGGVRYADLRGEIDSGRLEQEVIDRSISTGIFGALKNFTTQFSEGVTRPDYSSQIWSKHHETAVQTGPDRLESVQVRSHKTVRAGPANGSFKG